MPSLVRIRPVVWEENGDKQTNKQTDRQTDRHTFLFYIYRFLKKLFKRKNILIPWWIPSPKCTKIELNCSGGQEKEKERGQQRAVVSSNSFFLGWAKIPPVLTNLSHAGYFLLLFFSVSNFWGSSKSPAVVIWLPPTNLRRRMFALFYLKAFFREIARRFSPSLSVRWPPP